jgi:PhoH-like ATPase
MAELYQGIRVLEISKDIIDLLYKDKVIEIWDKRLVLHQNEYLVLKDETGEQSSALAKVKGGNIVLLPSSISASGIKNKNKEQLFAMDALLDSSIECVALTGRAGVGKSLLAISAALELIDKKKYQKIIICKSMTQLGNKNELGYLPGFIDEKFNIFNQGMLCNMGMLSGGKAKSQDLIEQYDITFLPLAVVRGSSWGEGTIVISDELQNLTKFELLSLGTRMGTGSKLVLLADFSQIDFKMKAKDCGLFHFINNEAVKSSSLVASINLIKVERGMLSQLFSEVFEEKEEK